MATRVRSENTAFQRARSTLRVIATCVDVYVDKLYKPAKLLVTLQARHGAWNSDAIKKEMGDVLYTLADNTTSLFAVFNDLFFCVYEVPGPGSFHKLMPAIIRAEGWFVLARCRN